VSVSDNVTWHPGHLAPEDRARVAGGRGATVWFTGFSGSGKSTVAAAVERRLVGSGRLAYLLDGDNLRHGLNGDLGFTAEDRTENIRRVAHVARLFADAGVVALVPVISPYAADRDRARAMHAEAGLDFVEVYVATALDECERRDPKGLYAKARAGEITGFTGIDDPYEPPAAPEVTLDTGALSVDESAEQVLAALTERGVVVRPH
jgi:adenylyl-sulfate kinase